MFCRLLESDAACLVHPAGVLDSTIIATDTAELANIT
jgi:hypothetical protein